MTQQSIIFLSGELPDRGGTRSAEQKLETIPTTDAEPDGMGKAMGAVVGGAVGASAGLAGGAAAASLLVPAWDPCLQSDWAQRLRWDSAAPPRERKQGMSPNTRSTWEFRQTMCSSSEEQAATARSVFKQQGGEDVDRARKELGKAA